MLDVNARSMLVTTQVAARSMIAAGRGGRIVNMASMGAKQAGAEQAHYAASKAAVVAADPGRGRPSSARTASPSTPSAPATCSRRWARPPARPRWSPQWSASSPLGRCAEPADVARMALFLASDDAAYCTGQAFDVTGGMVMR